MRKLRAFISLTDKKWLEKWKLFTDAGHEIVSTGGTARKLGELAIPCKQVSEVTGFPEILDGRLKSMHPLIMGGMLGDLRVEKHVLEMNENGIKPFDAVAVNLYDFVRTPGIENIDIGGPSALRAAAKNGLPVIMNPKYYEVVIGHLVKDGRVPPDLIETLAIDVFKSTYEYDYAISNWMTQRRMQGTPIFGDEEKIIH